MRGFIMPIVLRHFYERATAWLYTYDLRTLPPPAYGPAAASAWRRGRVGTDASPDSSDGKNGRRTPREAGTVMWSSTRPWPDPR